jgi:hypothetical protein
VGVGWSDTPIEWIVSVQVRATGSSSAYFLRSVPSKLVSSSSFAVLIRLRFTLVSVTSSFAAFARFSAFICLLRACSATMSLCESLDLLNRSVPAFFTSTAASFLVWFCSQAGFWKSFFFTGADECGVSASAIMRVWDGVRMYRDSSGYEKDARFANLVRT